MKGIINSIVMETALKKLNVLHATFLEAAKLNYFLADDCANGRIKVRIKQDDRMEYIGQI